MAHNRKLVLGGSSLTIQRVHRNTLEVMGEVRDELEMLLISSGYFECAPFTWVSIILRFGLKKEDAPHYQRIDRRDGELPLAIELDTHELREANRDELKRLYRIATLKALIHAGKKYNLVTAKLEEYLLTQY